MKNKKYLSITEHLNIVRTINHFKKNHIALFKKKNKLRFACGVALLGLGFVFTINPIPLGLPLISLGCAFMGITKRDLILKQREVRALIIYFKQKDRSALK